MTAIHNAAPQVTDVAILDEDEMGMAAVAVRVYLADIRASYRRNLRKNQDGYADNCVEKFDRFLALYERLGGNPDEVRDITDKAGPA